MIRIIGKVRWRKRVAELREQVDGGTRYARLVAQRHAAELAYEKCRMGATLTPVERRLARRVGALDSLDRSLSPVGRAALRAAVQTAASGPNTLLPLLHLHRTAQLHAASGYAVHYAGFEDGTNFDLLISRDGIEAEIACDIFSAEDGRYVHRAAWTRLVDQIDPDLQTWLAAHPGRYLLKMTLPKGLREAATEADTGMTAEAGKIPDESVLAALHRRITDMLKSARRADHDEAAVLRLDPLMLAAAQAGENGLLARLRSEFGPEANLAITAGGQSMFVLAARAGSENEVAVAMRRRLAAIAPARLSGSRPGIIAMFIDDTDRLEWRLLREKLTLEGEARHFLTFPEARAVVAVTCASRFEMVGEDETAMRFRNPSHPAAKLPALADAVLSVV